MIESSPPFDHWLVFSDLDGTLLNHDDYRHDAALPMLQKLENHGVPVIFNTSKTLAEMGDLRSQLHNQHPFIVENGSAIVLPDGYFSKQTLGAVNNETQKSGDYRVLVSGARMQTLREFLNTCQPRAIDFTQCSLAQAMELTGLTSAQARLAQTRGYSVPLAFDRPGDEDEFSAQASEAGLRTLRGGRFLHLLGDCDKGKALLQLKSLYLNSGLSSPGIIALGDSPNDLDMLTQADYAIVVESPSSPKLQLLQHPHCYRTRQTAPDGWVEGIEAILFSSSQNTKTQEKSYG